MNAKIREYEKKLKETLYKLKENLIDHFKKVIDKYPIHSFCSEKDIENLIKNIYEQRNEETIIIEMKFDNETKNTKKINNKKENEVSENIEVVE